MGRGRVLFQAWREIMGAVRYDSSVGKSYFFVSSIIFMICGLMASFGVAAPAENPSGRVVNSMEDRERLLGWDQQQKISKQLDKERLSDVREIAKEKKLWEAEQKKSLKSYRVWKKEQSAALDENSPEYHEDLELRRRQALQDEKNREDYVIRRERERLKSRATVHLSEKEELGIDQDTQRVPWEKRNLLGDRKSGGSSSSSGGSRYTPPAPRGNNDFIPPEFDQPPTPPPGSPPPEFFEPDIPPPPPALPDGGFEIPTMPPPLDEAIPPPVFDDEF